MNSLLHQVGRHRLTAVPLAVLLLLASASFPIVAAESRCFGTVANGRLEDGVKLPLEGPNFTAYSRVAAAAGRTYVHSAVASVVEEAYAALARSHPDKVFVYGETGWAAGGRFRPHRTHQNGLSVDFFVPVLDRSGKSVPIPTDVSKRFGYDLEFDAEGRSGEYRIDFEAIAAHLHALHVAAGRKQTGIALVIIDPAYLPKLFATARGAYLRSNLPFMQGKPWVRHDEHYHVDFAVRCAAGK